MRVNSHFLRLRCVLEQTLLMLQIEYWRQQQQQLIQQASPVITGVGDENQANRLINTLAPQCLKISDSVLEVADKHSSQALTPSCGEQIVLHVSVSLSLTLFT